VPIISQEGKKEGKKEEEEKGNSSFSLTPAIIGAIVRIPNIVTEGMYYRTYAKKTLRVRNIDPPKQALTASRGVDARQA